jgi:SAM-dependent methyltransferase
VSYKHEQLDVAAIYDPARYETPQRLASYYYQVSAVRAELASATRAINIGKGTGFLSWYLREQAGFRGSLVQLDIDARLRPDVLTSVASLSLADACCDIAFCCQVLEHLPFAEFDRALGELRRVLRPSGTLVLSLPNAGFYVQLAARLPKLRVGHLVPVPFLRARHHPRDSQHYWEIERRGYALGKVRGAIERHFAVVRMFRPQENPYHQFFIGHPRVGT